jgi:lycopene beta-cyclase
MLPVDSLFDVIIAGAGASGLSLAWHLSNEDHNLSIALIDESFEPKNDKTWCFWDDNAILDPSILHFQWDTIELRMNNKRVSQQLNTHHYNCVRSNRYQEFILSKIQSDKRFHLIESGIIGVTSDENHAILSTKIGEFKARYLFPSFNNQPEQGLIHSRANYLKQHFLGWDIKTNEDVFDPAVATLMDFRVDQNEGFAFVYVLPFGTREALVEITYFTGSVLPQKHYETILKTYLFNNWGISYTESNEEISSFEVLRSEFGVIPMIDIPYSSEKRNRIYPIGISGGLPKASTGYTFSRIQKDSKRITKALLEGTLSNNKSMSPLRYKYYDLLILHLLRDNPSHVVDIFIQLFKSNDFDTMFDFLDENLSLAEEIKIMSTVPKYSEFFKAMWETRSKIFLLT